MAEHLVRGGVEQGGWTMKDGGKSQGPDRVRVCRPLSGHFYTVGFLL